MQNVERLSITLPTEMAQMIRAKVQGGRYASNSEVIREAMRAWQEQEQLHTERLASIRAKLDDADHDPRPSLTDMEVEKYFEERLKHIVAISGEHA
jgi:antitoxin ParD1/3/4